MIGPRNIRHEPFPREGAEKVIVLGGIGPNFMGLTPMAKALHAAGYAVEVVHYPSTRHAIEPLVAEHLAPAIARANTTPDKPLHFVTFSMGGIVFRQLLQKHRPPNLGRAVLVAPPNNGSEVADFLNNWWPYRWLFGPAGQQLVTTEASVPRALGPVEAEFGVIAGTRSLDPWFSWVFRGKNDGKVSLESVKLAEMADFHTVPASHYFIMRHRETLRQATHFLREGKFAQ